MHTITLSKLPPGELFIYQQNRKKYMLQKSRQSKKGKIICYTYGLRCFEIPPHTIVRVRKKTEEPIHLQPIPTAPHF